MEHLNNYLPRDLVNVVDDYATDTTHHDQTVQQLKSLCMEIQNCIKNGRVMFLYGYFAISGTHMTVLYIACYPSVVARNLIVALLLEK